MPPSHGCCAHDHDCEAADCGTAYSLYKHVDIDRVTCLNEAVEGSCRNVFRAWPERLRPPDVPLRSNDDDDELLLHIPLAGAVKLKAICIIGGYGGSAPAHLKVFTNRDDLDFGTVSELAPVQEWDLQDDQTGVLEYPTNVVRFNGVHALDLYLTGNFGAAATEVLFVGLKGEFSERSRRAVDAVYEARPVPGDHKVPGTSQGTGWYVG